MPGAAATGGLDRARQLEGEAQPAAFDGYPSAARVAE